MIFIQQALVEAGFNECGERAMADFKVYFKDSAINGTHYIEETDDSYAFQILDIEPEGWYYLV